MNTALTKVSAVFFQEEFMEYAAIRHVADKSYCYALEKGHFLFRIQVKKGDIRRITMHYRDKNIPVKFHDTRKSVDMKLVATDMCHDYFEADIRFEVLNLRYYFELEDMDGKIVYYTNYIFSDVKTENIDQMFNCPQELRESDLFETPEWANNKVVYQIFPSRFETSKNVDEETWYKAPINYDDNLQGDLRGIIDHLEHLADLGIDVLYMTPIFQADTCHKYDTIDYYKIDPSFGTKEDLKELVEKAHKMGMKVLFDAVFNHTGTKFFAFADLLEKQENSKYKDWYYVEEFPLKWGWGEKPTFKTFAYFGGMPKLNLKNPEVQEYCLNVAKYWIHECDIDGWRLDVGDEVQHDFWKRFRKEVKSVKKDALIVGEVWYYADDFLRGDEWDTVMNYPFYGAVMDLVAYGVITVSQFAERIGFLKGNLHKKTYPLMFNLIDSHDTPRFLHSAGNSYDKQKLAAAFQLLSPGMPMIYYGDEYGMPGAQDPDNRRGMYWDEKYQNKEMFAWYRKLIALRKEHVCICEGETSYFSTDDKNGILILTRENQQEKVTLMFNCSKESRKMSQYAGMTNLISEDIFEGTLNAYEMVILKA